MHYIQESILEKKISQFIVAFFPMLIAYFNRYAMRYSVSMKDPLLSDVIQSCNFTA